MIDDLKGPLILSATIHVILVIVFAIWAMTKPDKKPEELIFELYAAAAPTPAYEPSISEEIYISDEVELPNIDDIEVEVNFQEPILEEPEVELKPDEPKETPKPVERVKMTREQFIKERGPIKEQRLSKKPKTVKRPDLSKSVQELERSLSKLHDLQLPTSVLSQISPQEQSELAHYFGVLKSAISNAVEQHPLSGQRLETKVEFVLHPNGRLSGARVLVSSGDGRFDQKVLAAFKRIGILGPPPGVHSSEPLTLIVYQEDR